MAHAPRLKITDNEASTALKRLLQKILIVVQLAPPYTNIRNAAERAIHAFKNHFVTGLASVNNNFTISMWCRIVKQAEINMNLLRTSRKTQGYWHMRK